MGAVPTGGGSTTSFTTTPQAKDDYTSAYEDYVFCFDVMSNDLGGAAKILWSVDDTALKDDSATGTYDLLTQDTAASIPEYSDLGAKIRVVNGKIQYDTNPIDSLGEGDTAIDSFTYAIRLANGTLSYATVYVTLTGTNDAPVLSLAETTGSVTEDVAADLDDNLTASGALSATDVDVGDVVTISSSYNDNAVWTGGTLTAEQIAAISAGFSADSDSWDYAVANAAVQFLGAGESITLSFTVTATDDSGTSTDSDSEVVTVTITGTNDDPDITVETGDSASEGLDETNAGLSISGTLTITDIDTSDVVDTEVSSVAVSGTGGAGALTEADLEAMLSLISGNDDNAADGTAGSLGWTFDSGSEAFNYLGDGETLILTYTLTASDGHTGSDTQTVTITITGSNDAPSLTGTAASLPAGTEDNSYTVTKAQLLEGWSDADGDTLVITGLSATNGSVVANADGSYTITPTADFNGSVTLNYNVSDGTAPVPTSLSYTLGAVNDAPVNTMAASYTTDEDTSVKLTGLSVADVDAGSGAITVTLSVASGTLTAANAGSVTVSGSGTNSIVLTGTMANINAYLAAAASQPTYVPVANANGDVTLTMTTSDGGNTGTGGALSDIDTRTITIAAVNDPASITGDAAKTIVEDAVPNTVSGNLDSTDLDGVNDSWQAQTIASVNSYGSLTINANGTWTYTLDNSNATVNALNDGSTPLTDLFTVKTADGTEQVITITINGHTDAPAGETRVNDPADDKDFDDPSTIAAFAGATVQAGNFNGDNAVNDVILGGSANQTLNGLGGNDSIHGAGGNDTINGNNNDDTLYGGAGDDTISGGGGNDIIYGGSGNDTIIGEGGNETIYGGSGNDDIQGSGGQDQLWGGTGQDDFIFVAAGDTGLVTKDKINDFSHAEGDHIDLSAFAGLGAGSFVGVVASAAALGVNQVGYVVNGDGSLTVFVDTNGAIGAEMAIDVVGVGSLQNSDFIL